MTFFPYMDKFSNSLKWREKTIIVNIRFPFYVSKYIMPLNILRAEAGERGLTPPCTLVSEIILRKYLKPI